MRKNWGFPFDDVFYFLWKWIYCSWAHRTYWDWQWPDEPEGQRGEWMKHPGRCYPRCDIPEGQPGSEDWHCTKCHPCGEELDFIFGVRNASKKK